MESRHLLMISLGGVIGTGLFLSSGYTDTSSRTDWNYLSICDRCDRGLSGHALFGGIISGDAGNWFISRLCRPLHWTRDRIYGRHPILADLDGRAWL